MGGSSSKDPGASSTGNETTPVFSPETVQQMCQEAYAAGAEDAGNHYMNQMDTMREKDFMMGSLACALAVWCTYIYGSTQTAREKAFGLEHMEAQKALLIAANEEVSRAKGQVSDLTLSLEARDELIQRQRGELVKAAKLRRTMTTSMKRLRRQASKTDAAMKSLQQNMMYTSRAMYGGAAAVTVLWIGTVWWVVRRGRQAAVPAPVAVVDAESE